jgi:predicted neuraminidase/mannose-6-phosphate isomerase-like protein (cupin superfamily)
MFKQRMWTIALITGVLSWAHAAAVQEPAKAPGGYVLERDVEVAKTEPGTHKGGGETIGYSFFAKTPGLKLVFRKRTLKPGSGIGYHEQKEDEIYYVLSGRGEMTIDGKTFEVTPGTAVLTRPGSSHGLKQIGAEDLVIMINYEQRGAEAPAASPIVRSEFLFETAAFPSVHASTIAETPAGLVAAWFGGTKEGASDVGIWVSRQANGSWTPPVEVATGVQPDGTRLPCWNPVLFVMPDRSLTLFYKVGPNPRAWWGMQRESRDNGQTWSEARRLPDGVLGPIKNKPVRLANGTIISGSSTESTDTPSLWRVHFERSTDAGRTWTVVRPPPAADGRELHAIQPSLLQHAGGALQAIGRSRSGRLFETWSKDGGATWTALALTTLPNPSAGTDAVTLRDGRHAVVYNHTTSGRTPLNLAVSKDGRTWEAALVLESVPGEYSYPAIIQTADGMLHITYTWKREKVRHVVVDPARLTLVPMPDGTWPASVK